MCKVLDFAHKLLDTSTLIVYILVWKVQTPRRFYDKSQ